MIFRIKTCPKNYDGGRLPCQSYPTAYNRSCWVTFSPTGDLLSRSRKSIVKDRLLLTGSASIPVGSPGWYAWLASAKTFSFQSERGNFTAQREKRRNGTYWYAYRRAGKLMKVYLGKAEELTLERLELASLSLTGQTLLKQRRVQPRTSETIESRIDTSFLPLTKVNVPALPRQLVSRPRLTRLIDRPLTVAYAPSGFGKSTLLNEWKQTCGHPVAWLSLDENDNDVARFWHSVILALQTVEARFGKELSSYLSTSSPIQQHEVVSRLTNEIVQHQGTNSRLGLVLDDFHYISRTEICDAIQSWIENLPSNMQLVLLGQTHPPLSLGHLRARGFLTELNANDLRFTLEEGIAYLRMHQTEHALDHADLARLVRHTEGWAAGLTLTALALSRQEGQRQFVDTFSGAHIYMREYFMETVLQRSSPEVQSFLFKTSILKNLAGGLCDAVTGQTGGEEMLARLWQEGLFILRLEEQGWYRYHDLFSEMLRSQLPTRFPDEVSQLHKRAAQWYRAAQAPADAVYHLLAIEAWEDAASLMEEMALRELEQYGEDSRLLRWLEELPAGVVQKHKTLLSVYLRLAQVALPRQKIEGFIHQIEINLSRQPGSQQTHDEHDVLMEIGQIRRAWDEGESSFLSIREGSENDARWELLDGLHLLRQPYDVQVDTRERQIAELVHKAQAQRNLFVLLMAGGVLARRVFISGQLRRSEKIARQILEQAFAQRGKLPEPASIALATLSQIHLERNELGLAEKYLDQAVEVDPNPTSSNMLVQIAAQRIQVQMMQQKFTEALGNSQSLRRLHLRRPSGVWTDYDLLTYESLIYMQMGELEAAEQLLNEVADRATHSLTELAWGELLLLKKQPEAAEQKFAMLILQYPNGITAEPLMRPRVLLAKAMFDQHKIHQALQVMKDAIRLAAPETFYRPFLDRSTVCPPLLSLALQAENLTSEAHAFIKELLRLSGHGKMDSRIAPAEIAALSASASISPREQDVLRLMNAGSSNRQIAVALSISESTVKTHVANIYSKLNVKSRVQAITYAKELKLV